MAPAQRPRPRTTRELAALAYAAAGTGPARLRSTPWPLLRLAGVANATVRELVEVRHEFEAPFLVDSSRIAAELGVGATPHAEGVARTLQAYRAAA